MAVGRTPHSAGDVGSVYAFGEGLLRNVTHPRAGGWSVEIGRKGRVRVLLMVFSRARRLKPPQTGSCTSPGLFQPPSFSDSAHETLHCAAHVHFICAYLGH